MATVLVIEDHLDTLELLLEGIRLEGWNAAGAANAIDALRLARHVQPDVVIADIRLPVVDGVSLEAEFQADPQLARIPFIFMTGYEPEYQRLGPQRVLRKPFELGALFAAIRTALASAIPWNES